VEYRKSLAQSFFFKVFLAIKSELFGGVPEKEKSGIFLLFILFYFILFLRRIHRFNLPLSFPLFSVQPFPFLTNQIPEVFSSTRLSPINQGFQSISLKRYIDIQQPIDSIKTNERTNERTKERTSKQANKLQI